MPLLFALERRRECGVDWREVVARGHEAGGQREAEQAQLEAAEAAHRGQRRIEQGVLAGEGVTGWK